MNFLFRYHNVNVLWYRYIYYMYMYLNILLFQFLIKNANDVHIAVVLLRVFYKMLIFFWNYRMGKQQQSLILIIHIGRWCMKNTRLDITINKQVILMQIFWVKAYYHTCKSGTWKMDISTNTQPPPFSTMFTPSHMCECRGWNSLKWSYLKNSSVLHVCYFKSF